MQRALRLIGSVVGAAVTVYGVSLAVTYPRSGRATGRVGPGLIALALFVRSAVMPVLVPPAPRTG